jgi:hypothetical protein
MKASTKETERLPEIFVILTARLPAFLYTFFEYTPNVGGRGIKAFIVSGDVFLELSKHMGCDTLIDSPSFRCFRRFLTPEALQAGVAWDGIDVHHPLSRRSP